ncbi:MAG: DUF1549 domain-containing protein, partial [Pirellulales bacterium]|nr:DUF1549 domain-containing protein [Pirellulales bacterium]
MCIPTQPALCIALVYSLLVSPLVSAQGADASSSGTAHWSFQPIREPHRAGTQLADPVSSPIDQFLLEKLQREQVAPSPAAAAPTLIKRLYLDLVGLLPTP